MFQKYDKLFSGGFFLLIALLIFSGLPSIRFRDVALGARFFPRIVGIIMLLIGGLLIIFGLLELKAARQKPPVPKFDKQAAMQIVFSLVILAVFGLLLPFVGIIFAGAVYLLGSFLILAPKKKWNILVFLIMSASIPVGVYFLFVHGFRVLLPRGSLWG